MLLKKKQICIVFKFMIFIVSSNSDDWLKAPKEDNAKRKTEGKQNNHGLGDVK